MTTQNNPSVYAQAIQYQLASIMSPIPVYANFNRNYATQPKFITWQLRNIHQPVYTGQTQSNKGIDRPIFQISIFAKEMSDAFNMSNSILQSLHGYSGTLGNPATTGFFVAKADVVWQYNSYDNDLGLHQVFLDCTLDVPA
jgi:hypothetical protein